LVNYENILFDHVPIDHSHSQQLTSRSFPVFKHGEWLVDNSNVVKRALLLMSHTAFFIGKTSVQSVRTKCRNSARRPMDGIDFNAKCTQCALVLPMKNA